MRKSCFSGDALREQEAGRLTAGVCRKRGISDATLQMAVEVRRYGSV